MKPIAALLPVSTWIFRITLFFFLILRYGTQVKTIDFGRWKSIVLFAYIVSSILLIIGGFVKKSTLTIIAGILIAVLSLYFMYIHIPEKFTIDALAAFSVYLFPFGIGLYFAAEGNK